MKELPFNPSISNTSPHFWAKDVGQTTVQLGTILSAHSWMYIGCMLSRFFALNRISIPNMFITILGLHFYKSLSIFLGFLLINLICCEACQIFFIYKSCQLATFINPSPKKIWKFGNVLFIAPQKNYMDLHIFT